MVIGCVPARDDDADGGMERRHLTAVPTPPARVTRLPHRRTERHIAVAVPLTGDDILRARTLRALDDTVREEAFGLPAERLSVSAARHEVRRQLHTWGFRGEVIDDMALMVSELFTNAVEHTHTDRISCVLRVADGLVCVEVTDHVAGVRQPRAVVASADQPSGRGLALVNAYADEWGILPAEEGLGHTVWATLRAHATAN
jgi:anti-sigma regulatory factor (Ser/Thr protein kinase)